MTTEMDNFRKSKKYQVELIVEVVWNSLVVSVYFGEGGNSGHREPNFSRMSLELNIK